MVTAAGCGVFADHDVGRGCDGSCSVDPGAMIQLTQIKRDDRVAVPSILVLSVPLVVPSRRHPSGELTPSCFPRTSSLPRCIPGVGQR